MNVNGGAPALTFAPLTKADNVSNSVLMLLTLLRFRAINESNS